MAQHILSKNVFLLDEFMPPEGTEFVCMINKHGRIEQSIFKNGIDMSEDKKEMFAMGVQLQNSMQSDFDYEFGTVHYTITERENARFVSIPTHMGILLAKLNKSVDPFVFVIKITEMIKSSNLLSL
ncbi:MAG: hypothetical protein WA833_09130 [Nitrosotalea sp.]